MRRQSFVLALAVAAVGAAGPLHAQVGVSCSLPADSYGGSGIPTDHSYCGVNGVVAGITIALSATPRYFSPAVTTDLAGTYFAGTGYSTGAPVDVGFSAWNFDFFIGGTSASSPGYFGFFSSGSLSTGYGTHGGYFTGDAHDSSNLGYGSGFDPFAAGEYTFDIQQYSDAAHTAITNEVRIKVEVAKGAVTATPEPASLALMATGLAGLAGFVRRRNNARAK